MHMSISMPPPKFNFCMLYTFLVIPLFKSGLKLFKSGLNLFKILLQVWFILHMRSLNKENGDPVNKTSQYSWH